MTFWGQVRGLRLLRGRLNNEILILRAPKLNIPGTFCDYYYCSFTLFAFKEMKIIPSRRSPDLSILYPNIELMMSGLVGTKRRVHGIHRI